MYKETRGVRCLKRIANSDFSCLTERCGVALGVLFDDKRLTCVVLMTWMMIVLCGFSQIGITQSQFMQFGPTNTTAYMGISINTWPKWYSVAIFTFVSTSINDFVSDALVPWIQNTVQDHKTRYTPYSKWTCWLIAQTWSLYCCVMGLFSINIMFAQVDFNIIRGVADMAVNSYTTYRFIKDKTHCNAKYKEFMTSDHELEQSTKMSFATDITRDLHDEEPMLTENVDMPDTVSQTSA